MMRLVLDSIRAARERRLASSMGIILVAVFFVAMATVLARSKSEADALTQSLKGDVSRIIEVRAGGETPTLPPWVALTLDEIPGVASVLAIGQASDVHHSETGRGPLPLRVVTGGANSIGLRACGSEGDVAIVDQRAVNLLGLDVPRGALVAMNQPLVKAISIGGSVVIGEEWNRPPAAYTTCPFPTDDHAKTTSVLILVESLSDIDIIASAVRAMIQPVGQGVSVVSQSELVTFRAALADAASRQRMRNLVVITAALLATSFIVGGIVGVARRQSFGRLRALGATRTDLAVLVMTETLVVSFVGAVAGSVSIATLQLGLRPWEDISWLPALAILSLVVSVLGVLPAVLVASLTDPVDVLRQP